MDRKHKFINGRIESCEYVNINELYSKEHIDGEFLAFFFALFCVLDLFDVSFLLFLVFVWCFFFPVFFFFFGLRLNWFINH